MQNGFLHTHAFTLRGESGSKDSVMGSRYTQPVELEA